MNILFVSSCYPSDEAPQYCVFLEQQALALQAEGHRVDILLLNNQKTDCRSVLSDNGERNGLRIYSWTTWRNKIKRIFQIPLKDNNIKRFLNDQSYDVVSLHLGDIGSFITITQICKSIGTMIVMHYHGLNIWSDYYQGIKQSILRPYLNFVTKCFLYQVDEIVGVSDLTCNFVKKKYKKENVTTVYNGVNPNLFFEEKNVKVADGKLTVLCIGNLIKIKGQKYLIEAVAQCIQKGYSIELRLGGEGSERTNLEEQCSKLGIENNVKFLGKLSYHEVAKEMRCSDIFILPSFFEAFGCVYLEAMASGLLTCGCYNNGISEIIHHNQNGLLVNEKDADSIEEIIRFAIDNPKEIKQIAQEGKRTSMDYSWEKSARQLEKVYMRLLMKKENCK